MLRRWLWHGSVSKEVRDTNCQLTTELWRVEIEQLDRHTDVLVLYVAPGLTFRLGLVQRRLSEVLDEHFLRPHQNSVHLCEQNLGIERGCTVAQVMTKAALLEHWATSGS